MNKMTDPASEYDSGIELVISSHKRLKSVDETNELLKFISIEEDERGIIIKEETRKEFINKYGYNFREGRKISLPWASLFLKYSNAMNEEYRRLRNH